MKIFVYDAETNYEVDDYEIDLEGALDQFYWLSDEKGSFFGMINNDNKIMQFAWEGEDKWLVDIPVKPGEYSLQKYASYDECVDLITYFYQGNNPLDIPELLQVFIMESTLDEVLSKM